MRYCPKKGIFRALWKIDSVENYFLGLRMPVPKRKRSRARRDKRFANKGMKDKAFTQCANCQEPLMTHQACKACGHYKGRKVLATKAERTVKRVETRKAQEAYKKTKEQPIEAEVTEK